MMMSRMSITTGHKQTNEVSQLAVIPEKNKEHDSKRQVKDVDTHQQTPEPASRKTGSLNPFGRFAEAVNRTYSDRSSVEQERQLEEVRDVLKQIAVVAFIGPSGTGKSTRAISIARKNSIAYLIDDGLLIHQHQIVAGASAKKAYSRLESVRQALFADETRAANMRRSLAQHKPATLMILGTSDAMLRKICNNLWLNHPSMLIRIEDVSTDEEIRQAKEIRMSQGKHTIPVPSMEIKHEFSGYFADPISRLRRRWERERGIAAVSVEHERTVVRPTFSALGSYSISDEAMKMMIEIGLRGITGVAGLEKFTADNSVYGVVLQLDLALYYGFNAQRVLQDVQQKINQMVEDYTSVNVIAVNVKARRVILDQSRKEVSQR